MSGPLARSRSSPSSLTCPTSGASSRCCSTWCWSYWPTTSPACSSSARSSRPRCGASSSTIPVLIFVKMSALLVTGVYRGIWRYISVDNLISYAKAVVAGSVASVLALLFAFRFEGFSRAVFVLDAMIFFMMLAGSRVAFRLFRQLIPAPSTGGRRVLIYGAGDAGELLLREMRNNLRLQYTPVGFVDDDPFKKGKMIHGLRVFGGNGHLRRICEEQQIELVGDEF